MNSIIFYGREASLWVSWALVMILIGLGLSIHWVGERLMPALARTADKIEVALNASNRPTSSKEESSA